MSVELEWKGPSTEVRMGFEPTYDGFARRPGETQSETLRAFGATEGPASDDRDRACFPMVPDDSSRNVTAKHAEQGDSRTPAVEPSLSTSDDAIKLAIKLAIDAGEYERAAALLEVAKRTAKSAKVMPIDFARGRER